MVFNNEHPSNKILTPEYLNNHKPGLDFHHFKWLKDEEIGSIPLEWNCLDGYYNLKYPKAMIYLEDVDENNGPFQYIEGTNNFINKVLIRLKNNFDFGKGKFTNDQVAEIIKKNNYNLKTFCKKAGTLILFDGNGIHRGSPLNFNKRYSLTNYYYFSTTGGDNFPMIKK